jgi:hypothetical protein
MTVMSERMKDFERRSRAAFDESVAAQDAATRARLARARELALADAQHWPRLWQSAWFPATAAAAAALMALLLWTGGESGSGIDPAIVALEELDIVMTGEDLDMFDEDFGFYAWATGGPVDDVG